MTFSPDPTRLSSDASDARTPTVSAPGRSMRVRVDAGRPLGLGGVAGPGRGSLLGSFRAAGAGRAVEIPSDDRRNEDRHHDVECQAWVGWRTWRGFAMNDAVLINLSRGGTRAFLNCAPPVGRKLWLFLETPGRKAVVKSRALEVQTTPSGQCVVRVAFDEPCPNALFEAAVCGQTASDPKTRPRAASALSRTPASAPARGGLLA